MHERSFILKQTRVGIKKFDEFKNLEKKSTRKRKLTICIAKRQMGKHLQHI